MSVPILLGAALLTSAPPISAAIPAQDAVAAEAPDPVGARAGRDVRIAEASPGDAPPFVQATAPAAAAPDAPTEAGQEDITVSAHRHHPANDPLEAINAKTFAVVQAVDRAVVRPMAKGYQKAIPSPIRDGIRNIINNLREPVVFLNFLLQLKPGKAIETVGRFAINSTVGVAGAVDVAKRKPFKLPRRPNGLANTLGYYGVKNGPFFFLPLVGPTTLRDVIGDGIDRLVLPVALGKPFNRPYYAIPVTVASQLDQRAEFDEKLEAMHKDVDPYARTREDYLRHRQEVIWGLHSKRWRDAHPLPPVVEAGAGTP